MSLSQIIGIILIISVLALYGAWIRFTRRNSGVSGKEEQGVQIFEIEVKGVYSPNVIRAKAGSPIRILFTRKESTECSRYIVFGDFQIRKELPEGQIVSVEFTPEKKGEYLFTCDMGMYQGKLFVE